MRMLNLLPIAKQTENYVQWLYDMLWFTIIITLTLLQGWWGRCEKNYLPKEEGIEGGGKKHTQPARRAQGSDPGPAAC